jgi:REP element-mobilizing transposase RayT
MARPLRIEYSGALYHVMSRGNERKPIVRNDVDREKRLDWLRRTVETYGWRLHAFVLMDNHDHLFVETPEPNLSAGMQFLNGGYTGYFNRQRRRSGHLFQGRFKAQLIEEEGYFLEVSRYIHLNPVRAKLAPLEKYPWSSYPGYVRSDRALPWVTYRRVLGEFGRRAAAARRSYKTFVRAGIAQRPGSPFAEAFQGLLLGSTSFIDRIGRLLKDSDDDAALPDLPHLRPRPALEEIVKKSAARFGGDPDAWQPGRRIDEISRAAAAYLARCHFRYSAREIASALGYRSHGGVHNAVKRIQLGPDTLKKTIEKLKQIFD